MNAFGGNEEVPNGDVMNGGNHRDHDMKFSVFLQFVGLTESE